MVMNFMWTASGDLDVVKENIHNEGEDCTEYVKAMSVESLKWKPDVMFLNLKDSKLMDQKAYMNGDTGATALTVNWVLEVSETLELECFPYDRQIIKFDMEVSGAIIKPIPEEFYVVGPEDILDGIHLPKSFERTHMTARVDLGNWSHDESSKGTCSKLDIFEGTDYGSDHSHFSCQLRLTRVPTYYLWNIVVVVFVLVLSAFSVVGIPHEEYADRTSITMTLLLTVVAFKFVISTYVSPTEFFDTPIMIICLLFQSNVLVVGD